MRKKTLVELGLAVTCGAKTRKGTPCRSLQTFKGGKCKFHGGLSTGPTTPEGRERSLGALRSWQESQKRIAAAARALQPAEEKHELIISG